MKRPRPDNSRLYDEVVGVPLPTAISVKPCDYADLQHGERSFKVSEAATIQDFCGFSGGLIAGCYTETGNSELQAMPVAIQSRQLRKAGEPTLLIGSEVREIAVYLGNLNAPVTYETISHD